MKHPTRKDMIQDCVRNGETSLYWESLSENERNKVRRRQSVADRQDSYQDKKQFQFQFAHYSRY